MFRCLRSAARVVADLDQLGESGATEFNGDSMAILPPNTRPGTLSGLASAPIHTANGAPELAIMRQRRHKSLNTVRKYIRDATQFRDNAATKLGL